MSQVRILSPRPLNCLEFLTVSPLHFRIWSFRDSTAGLRRASLCSVPRSWECKAEMPRNLTTRNQRAAISKIPKNKRAPGYEPTNKVVGGSNTSKRAKSQLLAFLLPKYHWDGRTCVSNTILPPTRVSTARVFGNSDGGTVKMSWDSTARSASFPTAMVPLSFSVNSA